MATSINQIITNQKVLLKGKNRFILASNRYTNNPVPNTNKK